MSSVLTSSPLVLPPPSTGEAPLPLYPLRDDLRQQYPAFLVLDFREAFEVLDAMAQDPSFPTLDVDYVMEQVIDGLYRHLNCPSWSRVVETLVFELMVETWLETDESPIRSRVGLALRHVFEFACLALTRAGLYNRESVLLYDYAQRRGKHSAVLRRKTHFNYDR